MSVCGQVSCQQTESKHCIQTIECSMLTDKYKLYHLSTYVIERTLSFYTSPLGRPWIYLSAGTLQVSS